MPSATPPPVLQTPPASPASLLPSSFNILIVVGSPRGDSVTATAADVLCASLARRGAQVRVMNLGTEPLPLFHPDDSPTSKEYQRLKLLMDEADAYILTTPDYHGSMSGILKNFLDHFWTEFAGKLVGTVCSSYEKGLTATDQIRTAIRQMYGWTMPYGVSLSPNDVTVAADGGIHAISNESVLRRLEMLARDMLVYGTLLATQRLSDLAGEESSTFLARYRTLTT
jgi:FMN reductase